MAKLKIETGLENEILRTKSAKIAKVSKEIVALAKLMVETMEKEKGVGLAAPQVGRNIRLILVTLNLGLAEEQVLAMVNPEIVFRSREEELDEEGCLSLPNQFDQVWRSREITVKFQNLQGTELMLKLSGFNARVVQHEMDHLEGVLFLDRVENKIVARNSRPRV